LATVANNNVSPTIFQIGRRKKVIDDEDRFCDPAVLSDVLRCKSIFDRLEPRELAKAREKSNTFETIGKGFFLNRAAMKMANMDAVFDFMFTCPSEYNRLF
jgi:cap1 methyltransferase